MSQSIRDCETSDSVRIAYAVMGTGPPLVVVSGWFTHLELEWKKPFVRQLFETLGRGRTLLRYDMRGTGLSSHDVADFRVDLLVKDIEAVVDAAGLDEFALLSLGDLGGPISIAYASRHSHRVHHLVLHASYACGQAMAPDARQQAYMIDFVTDHGFPVFEILEDAIVDVVTLREIREVIQATPRENQAKILRAFFDADVSHQLPKLSMPTLVLHATNDHCVPFEAGKTVGAGIVGSRFVPYHSPSPTVWSNASLISNQVASFLHDAPPTASRPAGLARTQRYSSDLTARQVEVLCQVALGKNTREIADELVLSVRTIERHISNAYLKIDAHSRAQATAYTLRNGLIG